MEELSFEHIAIMGNLFYEDSNKKIYLTPEEPHTYHSNQWIYKQLPNIEEWRRDVQRQQQFHQAHQCTHLAFTFPANHHLDNDWKQILNKEGYQLGVLELYVIESAELARWQTKSDVQIQIVDKDNLEDYLTIYKHFALPFGHRFADESVKRTRIHIQQQYDNVVRLLAYYQNQPAGILDMIVSDEIVEIDGFGVLENYQHQGIGSTLQAYVGQYADTRPVILVADGEDTARDMYLKQGYIYKGFCYQVVKENIK
ncbi:GNAT family N-acetyltransferase [Staphylococcus lugdunensis]|uniref:N-acetyltransferase n=1 Tax=Staphylococcus lugdunensis TaxID=28035 RepID=A0A292DKJ9_STALU|nr:MULTISPECIES: GNAT family N-acetyltransferase [Staphylococcus]ADC86892.1 Acetyltransferase [Staphylococcus lugdunensis HKU09-01]AMG62321.1 acetyltransferase [Staphylococcus lugdunensis]AMG63755.1 N-acetyltransferase [Staphylococcus lugdunensis]ARB77175.1 N-acetyltransferase [Staphylococcus lugdunensis]ARJ08627.1 N-acetyltransferase [Staphylococcus lugdunensis]